MRGDSKITPIWWCWTRRNSSRRNTRSTDLAKAVEMSSPVSSKKRIEVIPRTSWPWWNATPPTSPNDSSLWRMTGSGSMPRSTRFTPEEPTPPKKARRSMREAGWASRVESTVAPGGSSVPYAAPRRAATSGVSSRLVRPMTAPSSNAEVRQRSA